jgi:hypothetical protein
VSALAQPPYRLQELQNGLQLEHFSHRSRQFERLKWPRQAHMSS